MLDSFERHDLIAFILMLRQKCLDEVTAVHLCLVLCLESAVIEHFLALLRRHGFLELGPQVVANEEDEVTLLFNIVHHGEEDGFELGLIQLRDELAAHLMVEDLPQFDSHLDVVLDH